jgi:glucose-1-phosphate thymidylyltransferase
MRRADDEAALSDAERAAAETGVKALIPIERPFLDYVLSALADAGYRQVCLVVAPDHEAIRSYYRQVELKRLMLNFAVQVEPKGTADAVAAAEAFAGRDPFLVVNSDNYYPVDALRRLRQQDGFAAALFERESMLSGSNIAPERVKNFAVAEIRPNGMLERIREKPDAATLAALPKPHWLSMNCWRFTPAIFEACRRIPPSPRNEFEITDAVQYVIDVLRHPFRAVTVCAPVLDLTSRKDITTIKPILSDIEVRL